LVFLDTLLSVGTFGNFAAAASTDLPAFLRLVFALCFLPRFWLITAGFYRLDSG